MDRLDCGCKLMRLYIYDNLFYFVAVRLYEYLPTGLGELPYEKVVVACRLTLETNQEFWFHLECLVTKWHCF